jgi:hypothetical protein
MKKLYKSGGYIDVSLIKDALINAKKEGKLPNVPSLDIKYFVEGFEEEMQNFKSKVGSKINQSEVKFLVRQMMRNKSDKISDSELRVIEKILLDKDFDID